MWIFGDGVVQYAETEGVNIAKWRISKMKNWEMGFCNLRIGKEEHLQNEEFVKRILQIAD